MKTEILGDSKFQKLTELLGDDKKLWSKVARMIQKANSKHPRPYDITYNEVKRDSIQHSLNDTILPENIKEELRNIYHIKHPTDGWWEDMKRYPEKWI